MLIDWTTVIAQIVNFLILLVLLKYFLYDRIISAMDKREERIQDRLEEAERKRQEAERELNEFEEKNRKMDRKREEILNQAREEAESYKKELIQDARQEVESLQKRWRRSIEQEKESFIRELRRLAGKQVYDICRRALAELADTEVQDRTVAVFIDRFERMEEGKKADLLSVDGAMVVKSGQELDSEKRKKIEKALQGAVEGAPEISYETDPDLILGIEVKRRDKKVAWSLENYLSNLERETLSAFEKEAKKHREQAGESEEETSEKEAADTETSENAESETA